MITKLDDLWEICEPYWIGFFILSRGRGYIGGEFGALPQGLSYTEMVLYAQNNALGSTPEDLADTIRLLSLMDKVFIEHYSKS